MVFDVEPLIFMPPPANVSVTLTFEPITFKTYSVHLPTIVIIWVNFRSNIVSGSGAMRFTKFS